MVRFQSILFVALFAALLHGATPCAAQSEWVTSGFGLWNDGNNWTSGVPNNAGDSAIFGLTGGLSEDAFLDSPITVGELQFLGPDSR